MAESTSSPPRTAGADGGTGLVGIDAIEEAARLLDGVALRTPVEGSRHVSALAGGPVVLKCEHLQRTGSFKLRGAFTRVARLDDDARAAGIVAASAGNHAQGVALAARLQGVDAVVFMPANAPIPKVQATRGYGAEVRFVDGVVDDCLDAAHDLARAEGRVLVHPFDHPDVIAGQGTLGLEVAAQAPDVRTVLVPIGGGGLVSGTAVALRARLPQVRIVGVQAAGAASIAHSRAAGGPTPLPTMDTIADGIAVRRPGDLTMPHVDALVDDVVTVEDRDTARAVLLLLERAKQLVEPSGAVGLGALLAGLAVETPAAIVLSGGNIDPLVVRQLVSQGLAEEGRYLSVQVRIADTPGSLVRLLDAVADARANVVTVEHHRLRESLGMGRVEVWLELEARGHDHAHEIVARLRDDGYDVEES